MITCEIHCAGGLNMPRHWKSDSDGRSGSRPAWILGFALPDITCGEPTEVAILLLKPGSPNVSRAKTEKIRLGTLVTPIPFRHRNACKRTVLLSTCIKRPDILGVGAGVPDRIRGYSEWIRTDPSRQDPRKTGPILKLWTQEKSTSKGKHYHATEQSGP